MGSLQSFASQTRPNIGQKGIDKKMKHLCSLVLCVVLFSVLATNGVQCYVKRAFNPKLSHVYEARRQRFPSEYTKRSSDAPINLSNVETLLNGIMDDLDTILEEWEENPSMSGRNRLAGVSFGTQDALKHDSAWLRAALSKARSLEY